MLRRSTLLVLMSASLWLGGSGETRAAAERPAAGEFTAVKMKTAPTMDGKIDPGEWDGVMTTSAVIAAFDNKLITSAQEMAIGFDDTKFYFLFKNTRAPGEWRLPKAVRSNDDYAFSDPSVEVWVAPPKRIPEAYQSVINTYPAVLDMHNIPTRGYTAQGWKGGWVIGVSEDPDQYIIEASIPIKDFGVEKISDGDVWKFLLCRTAQGARPRSQGSWSLTTGFAEIAQYPPVRLAFDDVAVQLRGSHTLISGKYNLPLTLVGASKDQTVNVEYRFHKATAPGDASDIVKTEQVSLKANQKHTIDIQGSVPADWTTSITENKEKRDVPAGNFTMVVTGERGKTLFRQTLPYTATGWTPARPTKPEKAVLPKELAAMIKYGPENNVVLLRADIFELPTRSKVTGGTVRLLDPAAGDKELLRQPLPKFKEFYADSHFFLNNVDVPTHDFSAQDKEYDAIKKVIEENRDRQKLRKMRREQAAAKKQEADLTAPELQNLPLPEKPPMTPARKVVVEITVNDESGAVLATERQDLDLLRTKFTWQNNTLGMSDKVIPPWTPIKVQGDSMSVWNRKLEVDGLGLIKGIDNGGVSQIKSMRLMAVKNGQTVAITPTAPKVIKQTDAAVNFEGTGSGAGLNVSSKNTLEFDGYVTTDLTIAPQTPGEQLDKLYLEVILPEAEATHFCVTAGGWAASHDETPAYWSSQQTSAGNMVNDFVPYIWLTNSDRAFLWVADNDKGWITEGDKSVATQEIIRKDGVVTLRLNFVEIPAKLDQPTTIRYAYQNFPSRPLPGGWRSWVCNGTRPNGAPGARIAYFYPNFEASDWVINWPYYGTSFPHSWERSKAFFSKQADFQRPTAGSIAHSIGFYRDYQGREFSNYSVDWGEMPGHLGNNDVTQSRGPTDLRIYHYNEWARRSNLKALYADENYIAQDRNFLTGGAYYRPDGQLQPGYTYMGLRDYYKRLKYVFHDAGVATPNVWLHITGGAAYHAWLGDILMEAENVGPSDEEFDYLEVLPAARMRSINSAVVNGGAQLIMCQAMRHSTPLQEKHIHQFVGWVQAHDALPEQVAWHAPIAQAARFYRDDVEFIGYWKPEVPVKFAAADAVASVHKVPGRALVWMVNSAREDRKLDLQIDWQKLGLDKSRTVALNAETGEEVALTATGLTVPILKRDFVAVHLVQKDKLSGSQSFIADFEQSAMANEALGSEMFEGGGELVNGEKGKALSVAGGVSLLSPMNLHNKEGKLAFRANFTGQPGTVLKTSAAPAKKGEDALPAGVIVEVVKKGKDPAKLVIRRDDNKSPDRAEIPAPAAGWQDVVITWQNGRIAVQVGNESAAIAVDSLNVLHGTGNSLSRSAKFTFGGVGKSEAITAIDDLIASRKAE